MLKSIQHCQYCNLHHPDVVGELLDLHAERLSYEMYIVYIEQQNAARPAKYLTASQVAQRDMIASPILINALSTSLCVHRLRMRFD